MALCMWQASGAGLRFKSEVRAAGTRPSVWQPIPAASCPTIDPSPQLCYGGGPVALIHPASQGRRKRQFRAALTVRVYVV